MKKFKNLSSNRAITLIALIITIIIMLILVGVSISLVIQSDLIGVAQEAGDRTTAKYQEEAGLSGVAIGDKTYNSIEEYIAAQGGQTPPVDEPEEGINIKLSMVSTEVPVTADGTYVDKIKEGVPIPEGFYYVGGTKNTGVVISDSSADENTTNITVAENLTGNQYVWVPVLQNQKLKVEVTSEEEITNIKIEDPLFSEIPATGRSRVAEAPSYGTSYTVEVDPSINGTYTVTVEAGGNTETKTLKVSSLYAQDFFIRTKEELKVYYLTMEEFKDWYRDDDGEIVEEWLEGDYGTTDINEAYDMEIDGCYQEELEYLEVCKECTDSTIAIYKNSVNTYGGFYIARYEAGSENNRYSDKSSSTVYSQKNKYPFNYVTQAEAIALSQAVDTGKASITSDLINAAAWDRTLNWLVETNAIQANELFDSKSWGNYIDSEFDFIGKYSIDEGENYTDTTTSKPTYDDSNNLYLLGTGVSNYTKRNNIYDLAGNCSEWTTEACYSDCVVTRSGYYGSEGSGSFASGRNNGTQSTSSFDSGSFRHTLYIRQVSDEK